MPDWRAWYRAGVRLYPADYRVRFESEMIAVFDEACGHRRPSGGMPVAREFAALAAGISREWRAKLTTDPLRRARHLPDCRMMRPVGITRREWAAGLPQDGDDI